MARFRRSFKESPCIFTGPIGWRGGSGTENWKQLTTGLKNFRCCLALDKQDCPDAWLLDLLDFQNCITKME